MRVINTDLSVIRQDNFRLGVWNKKYGKSGNVEKVIRHISREVGKRVPKELQITEFLKDNPSFEEVFYNQMMAGKFLPGGRVISYFSIRMSEDKKHKLTPMNCYVIPILEDSLPGIFKAALDMALTYSWGGGCGGDISSLRPRGSSVLNAAISSTGAASFMPIYDSVTGVIGQKGRRGALLLAMNCQHPDIIEFMESKKDNVSLENMNLSLKTNDEFFKAVENDEDWELWYPHIIEDKRRKIEVEVPTIADCYNYPNAKTFKVLADNTVREKVVYKTVKARKIIDVASECACKVGCPGVIFWNVMNEDCPYGYTQHKLQNVNPCAEEPLPSYGACNLASINLMKFVDPVTGKFNFDEFVFTTKLVVVFLDTLNSIAIEDQLYPLEQQWEVARDLRLIGVGITGLGDALVLSRIKYDSEESLLFIEEIMKCKEKASYEASVYMGKVLGSYPAFDYEVAMEYGHLKKMKETNPEVVELLTEVKALRNGQLSTVAPTGTTSQILGCSTGIEPIYATEYVRKVKTIEEPQYVKHWLIDDLIDLKLLDSETYGKVEYIKTAHQIKPDFRVKVQGIAQKYTDGSISSTINLPRDTTPKLIREIYISAYKSGCKGITIYRQGSKDSILKTMDEVLKDDIKLDGMIVSGDTIRIPFDPKWYLTLNTVNDTPIEVFINAGKSGSDDKSWTEAIGRLISIALQDGTKIEKIIDALKDNRGDKCTMRNGWIVHSGPDAIAKALIKILRHRNQYKTAPTLEVCPQCNTRNYVESGGCGYCNNCGFTACGG